jgi:Ran GTPase-activating protein (RanGAP) involved in mRNA processing and transport
MNIIICNISKMSASINLADSPIRQPLVPKEVLITSDPIARMSSHPDAQKVIFSNKKRDFTADEIIEFMKHYPGVNSITIQSEYFHDAAITTFATYMATNTSISELILTNTYMTDADIRIFANMLRTNTALNTLKLDQSRFGPIGLRYLVDALKVNTTLKTLFLDYNDFESSSSNTGPILRDLLMNNVGLEKLSLNACRLRDTPMEDIADGLVMNTTLKDISLRFNYITSTGADHLARALEVNTNLKMIYESNDIPFSHRIATISRRGQPPQCIIS